MRSRETERDIRRERERERESERERDYERERDREIGVSEFVIIVCDYETLWDGRILPCINTKPPDKKPHLYNK